MNDALAQIAAIFARLSLLAFGGGNTVLPEMQRQVVDVHHWMSASDFSALFALAQAAPGPNMMVSTLIGFHVGGVAGAVLATLCLIGPSSLLTIATVSAWQRFRDEPWRKIVQAGITPVTIGLVAASAAVVVSTADASLLLAGITVAVAAVTLATKWHPLWMLAAGACIAVLAS